MRWDFPQVVLTGLPARHQGRRPEILCHRVSPGRCLRRTRRRIPARHMPEQSRLRLSALAERVAIRTAIRIA